MKISVGDIVRIKTELSSNEEPRYIHKSGTEARVVLLLGANALLAEIHVYDPTLEGDAWYETFDLRLSEVERVSAVERVLTKRERSGDRK